jgi:hypothetical protein
MSAKQFDNVEDVKEIVQPLCRMLEEGEEYSATQKDNLAKVVACFGSRFANVRSRNEPACRGFEAFKQFAQE